MIVTRADSKAAGLPRYFTGKPCKRGHVSERTFPKSECITCKINGRAERYAENVEASREAALMWYKENLERSKQTRRLYGELNAEVNKLRCSSWYENNKQRAYENNKAWRHKNKENVKAWNKRWQDANPEHRRTIVRNRRARQRAAEGSHTANDIKMLAISQNYRCVGCCVSIEGGWHVDHIHPLSKGGSNYAENLQLLCPSCNLRKHAKLPLEWAKEIGRSL